MLGNDFRDYYDNGFLAEETPLKPYTVIRQSAAYRDTGEIELFGRLENAFDEDYEEVFSYGTAHRAVYGGLRFTLP